jgi:hypothetical protein
MGRVATFPKSALVASREKPVPPPNGPRSGWRPLTLCLRVQDGGQIAAHADIQGALTETDGARGATCEALSELTGVLDEFSVGYDAVDQAKAFGLMRIDDISGKHQLRGLMESDQPRQEEMAAAIGDQPDADEHVAEACLSGCQDDVTGKRQIAPGPGGDAVDRGDERLLDGPNRQDQGIIGAPQTFRARLVGIRRRLARLNTLPGLEVGARTKAPPGTCEHHSSHAGIVSHGVQHHLQFLDHLWSDGIEHLRSIKHDRGDALVDLVQQGLVGH